MLLKAILMVKLVDFQDLLGLLNILMVKDIDKFKIAAMIFGIKMNSSDSASSSWQWGYRRSNRKWVFQIIYDWFILYSFLQVR